jgi:hypothetical protein
MRYQVQATHITEQERVYEVEAETSVEAMRLVEDGLAEDCIKASYGSTYVIEPWEFSEVACENSTPPEKQSSFIKQ